MRRKEKELEDFKKQEELKWKKKAEEQRKDLDRIPP